MKYFLKEKIKNLEQELKEAKKQLRNQSELILYVGTLSNGYKWMFVASKNEEIQEAAEESLLEALSETISYGQGKNISIGFEVAKEVLKGWDIDHKPYGVNDPNYTIGELLTLNRAQ